MFVAPAGTQLSRSDLLMEQNLHIDAPYLQDGMTGASVLRVEAHRVIPSKSDVLGLQTRDFDRFAKTADKPEKPRFQPPTIPTKPDPDKD